MNRVFIKTYGCQMNERDSDAVAAMLRERGYAIVDSEAEADIILLNTCSVREQAEQKAIGKAGRLLKARRLGLNAAAMTTGDSATPPPPGAPPLRLVGVIGCMAQNRGAALLDSLPDLDLVAGTQKFHRVPDHLDNLLAGLRALGPRPASIVDTEGEPGSQNTISAHSSHRAVSAFVSIMQGCDMNCTYCIVPKTRGRERARPMDEIVDEVRALAERGTKEVVLLGQLVNHYGLREFPTVDGKSPFVQLLEKINALDGIERIRFTSPHPAGFRADLVDCYRRLPKLCEDIHLPVQSGSDRILRAMRRTYTRERYLRIVEALRAANPAMRFSTDIIVGFPGETDADFEETLSLFDAVRFDMAFIFKYSPRSGTPAESLGDTVPREIKELRNQILLGRLETFSNASHRALVGTVREVLVECPSRKGNGLFMGRDRGGRKVLFPGTSGDVGRLLNIHVEKATTTVLMGTVA
ncbi:MAG: tRNA (N6-isopentenyl adenosine(37)-C2)-methylthiotransferase MiaB [Puniceicoccales bacterium]|nr:tRNA (N6-isopentenyl adenosine(37)-C2)-methylthiotransferase MiaB [Puniceicoccales bacterium]